MFLHVSSWQVAWLNSPVSQFVRFWDYFTAGQGIPVGDSLPLGPRSVPFKLHNHILTHAHTDARRGCSQQRFDGKAIVRSKLSSRLPGSGNTCPVPFCGTCYLWSDEMAGRLLEGICQVTIETQCRDATFYETAANPDKLTLYCGGMNSDTDTSTNTGAFLVFYTSLQLFSSIPLLPVFF